MIRIDCKQGSEQWRRARAGVVTASCLDRLLTPKTRKPAAGAKSYLNELLAEYLIGGPLDEARESGWQLRGHEMEEEARGWYELDQDVQVEEVGFLLRDDRKVGASPDGLVGTDGGVEIKVPSVANHVGFLRDPDSFAVAHYAQVQGGLIVTGRAWWDLVSFNPVIQPLRLRIHPDPVYLAALRPVLDDFLATLEEERAKFAEMADATFDPIASPIRA